LGVGSPASNNEPVLKFRDQLAASRSLTKALDATPKQSEDEEY
jgi:hypothetical protein